MHSALFVLTAFVAVATATPFQVLSAKQTCMSTSGSNNGAKVTVHACGNEDASRHTWDIKTSGNQPVKLSGTNQCIDVQDGKNADGTKLQLWECVQGSTNQQFNYRSDGRLQWVGTDKCIDLTDGTTTDGVQLQLWTCLDWQTNQVWNSKDMASGGGGTTPPPATTGKGVNLEPINVPCGVSLCLTAASNTDGAQVMLAPCTDFSVFPSGNRTWFYPDSKTGAVKTFDGSKCLDVVDGNKNNGARLQIWSCYDGSANQQFKLENNHISWTANNKCFDVADGKYESGNPVQLWDCDSSNKNQDWWSTVL